MRYAMSRRRRNVTAAVLVLTAVALSALDYSCTSRTLNSPPQSSARLQNSADLQKYEGKQFTVVKVVDGDTLDIDIPDASASGGQEGGHTGPPLQTFTRIRLWGVDTPETKDPRLAGPMFFGPEASEFATKAALGKRVTIRLEKKKNSRGKYGRLLAYVQLPDGKFLNEELLNEGCAYADTRFKHGLYNKYKQLESLARSQKKGLWQNITPEQMPQWRQQKIKD